MYDLLICYSRRDTDLVTPLVALLGERDRAVFIDEEDIPPTVEWRARIDDAIIQSRAVLCALSPAFAESEECRREITHALQHGKRLIPLVVEQVAPEALPLPLRALQWINARADHTPETTVDSILEALETDFEWLDFHTWLAERSSRWKSGGSILSGRDLKTTLDWLESSEGKSPALAAGQLAFVTASQRAAAHRQRRVLVAVLAALVLIAGVATWALLERHRKEVQRRVAAAREQTARAELVRDQRMLGVDESVRLASDALDELLQLDQDTNATAATLRRSLALLPLSLGSVGSDSIVDTVVAPESREVVSLASNGTIGIQSIDDPSQIYGHSFIQRADRVATDPRGQVIVAWSRRGPTGRLDVWVRAENATTRIPLIGRVADAVVANSGQWVVAALERPDDGEHGHAICAWTALGNLETCESIAGDPLRVQAVDEGSQRLLVESSIRKGDGSSPLQLIREEWMIETDPGGLPRLTRLERCETHVPYQGAAQAFAFDRQMRHLATVDSGGLRGSTNPTTLRLWENRKSRLNCSSAIEFAESSSVQLTRGISGLEFSPNGSLLLVSGADYRARMLAVPGGLEVGRVEHQARVRCARFVDGVQFITLSGQDRARLYALTSDVLIRDTPHLPSYIRYLALSEDRTRVATVSAQRLELWNRSDQSLIASHPIRSQGSGERKVPLWPSGRQPVFVDDDRKLVVPGSDRTLILDASTGSIVARLDYVHAERFALSPRGRYVAVAAEGIVEIYSVGTGQLRHTLPANSPQALEFDPSESYLAVGDQPGRVWQFSDESSAVASEWDGQISAITFNENGGLLAFGSGERMHLVATQDWRSIDQIEVGHSIHEIHFAPGGELIWSAEQDPRSEAEDTLVVRSRSTGEEVLRIEGSDVLAAAFSPNGESFAVSVRNQPVRVWDSLRGENPGLVAELPYKEDVFRLLFEGDGLSLLSAVRYELIARSIIDPRLLLATARRRLDSSSQ